MAMNPVMAGSVLGLVWEHYSYWASMVGTVMAALLWDTVAGTAMGPLWLAH